MQTESVLAMILIGVEIALAAAIVEMLVVTGGKNTGGGYRCSTIYRLAGDGMKRRPTGMIACLNNAVPLLPLKSKGLIPSPRNPTHMGDDPTPE